MFDRIKSKRVTSILKTATSTYAVANQVYTNPLFKRFVLPKLVGSQEVNESAHTGAFNALLDTLMDTSISKSIVDACQRHDAKRGWYDMVTSALGVSRIGGKFICSWSLHEGVDGYRRLELLYPKMQELAFIEQLRIDYPLSRTGVYHYPPNGNGKPIPEELATKEQFVDSEVYDTIMARIDRFDKGREWYEEQGLPYKETILFYGPPGCGKTSMVRHIASKYRRTVYSKTSLPTSVDEFPRGGIILIEDIDRIKLFMDKTPDEQTTDVSQQFADGYPGMGFEISRQRFGHTVNMNSSGFSDVLNVLDGPEPLDDVIIIMTANNPARLRKALHRPGRIDGKVHFDFVSESRFYSLVGWEDEVLINRFEEVAGEKYRTASMVPIMRRCKTTQDIDVAMENIIFKETEEQENY